MFVFDPSANFVIADVSGTLAAGATSLTLATGLGALFPDPASVGAYNIPIFDSTLYTTPDEDPNKEILRVTAKSTDTLTVTRAQEGTADVNHTTGGSTYRVYMTPSAKVFTDLTTAIKTAYGAGGAYATTGGTSTAFTATVDSVDTYAAGDLLKINFNAAATSTTPTLNVNSLGAKTIKRPDGSALVVGDIPINWRGILVYDGTDMLLMNPALLKVADLGFIADANGNELIIFDTVASAVNEATFANAATGSNPKLSATGGDTDVGLDFQAKGAGVYRFLGTATQAAELRLYEDTDDGSNYTAFKTGAQSASITYTLPTTVGAAGTFLTDAAGNGTLSWAAAGGGSDPQAIAGLASDNAGYTDDLNYIPVTDASGTNVYLCNGSVNKNGLWYKSGVAQTVTGATVFGAAGTVYMAAVIGGYLYVQGSSSSTHVMRRCLLTNDIATGGNWVALTLSGAGLGNDAVLVGYENGNFWFTSSAGTSFVHATLSGTTLTQQGTVTVTGSSYTVNSRVNNDGIWASFGSPPGTRLASTSGTLDGNNQFNGNAVRPLAYATSIYAVLTSTTAWYRIHKR